MHAIGNVRITFAVIWFGMQLWCAMMVPGIVVAMLHSRQASARGPVGWPALIFGRQRA